MPPRKAKAKREPVRWRWVLTVALVVGGVVWLGVYFGADPAVRHLAAAVAGKPHTQTHPFTRRARLQFAWLFGGISFLAVVMIPVNEWLNEKSPRR
jgi:hypothetical protein